VALVPCFVPSRAFVSSDFSRRSSFASLGGSGDETTSLNALRKCPASVSGNLSDAGVRRRMTASPRGAFPARPYVFNNGLAAAVFHFHDLGVVFRFALGPGNVKNAGMRTGTAMKREEEEEWGKKNGGERQEPDHDLRAEE
jgi:hypothetical protein